MQQRLVHGEHPNTLVGKISRMLLEFDLKIWTHVLEVKMKLIEYGFFLVVPSISLVIGGPSVVEEWGDHTPIWEP